MKIDIEDLTSEVCRIAKETGVFLAKKRLIFQKERIEIKSANNFVSYVDKAAENLVVEKLSGLLDDCCFITEEETIEYIYKDYCWIIDPLDGTTNFIHDNAPYCVSIALSYKKELILGVVYEVCRDECFYTWKGSKSYLNGQIIEVSKVNDFSQTFIELDLPYNNKEYKPVINSLLDQLYGNVNGIRINGSSAMSLCYVAAGRFEIYAEAFINIWDFAAGALIVQHAGGLVTDFTGNKDFMKSHHVVASNNLLHSDMISLLAPFPMK